MSDARSGTAAIPVDDLRTFTMDLLRAVGATPFTARSVADGLIAADLEGQPSHGLMLLTMYLDRIVGGSVSPAGPGRIVSDSGSSVVMDAENALGQVTSERAVALAIERAAQHGIAAISFWRHRCYSI